MVHVAVRYSSGVMKFLLLFSLLLSLYLYFFKLATLLMVEVLAPLLGFKLLHSFCFLLSQIYFISGTRKKSVNHLGPFFCCCCCYFYPCFNMFIFWVSNLCWRCIHSYEMKFSLWMEWAFFSLELWQSLTNDQVNLLAVRKNIFSV